jgi:hypothetical protein
MAWEGFVINWGRWDRDMPREREMESEEGDRERHRERARREGEGEGERERRMERRGVTVISKIGFAVCCLSLIVRTEGGGGVTGSS